MDIENCKDIIFEFFSFFVEALVKSIPYKDSKNNHLSKEQTEFRKYWLLHYGGHLHS